MAILPMLPLFLSTILSFALDPAPAAQEPAPPAPAEAEVADLAELAADLEPLLQEAPAGVSQTAEALSAGDAVAELGPLIEALYEWGEEGVAALAAVRRVLRRDIDRRMEVAT